MTIGGIPRLFIAGLGNLPYPSSRHSVGQIIVDALSKRFNIPLSSVRGGYEGQGRAELATGPVDLTLFKSKHAMNISGRSIVTASRQAVSDPSSVIVIVDSLSHKPGILSPKFGGSAEGHNGVKSITSALGGASDFHRFRIGIGRDGDPVSYVMTDLPSAERTFWKGSGLDLVVNNIEKVIQKKSKLPATPYIPPPPTQAKLDYAELPTIDLALRSTPAGVQQLTEQVKAANAKHGFFYVVNHGYTPAQTARMFDISNLVFSEVSDEEKQRYTCDVELTGSFQGYKPLEYWHINGGVYDRVDNYNIHRDVRKREHPEALRPFLPEIEAFAKHNHFNVLHPILELMALGLGLPGDTFVKLHNYDAEGETSVTFMKYHPRTEDDEQKSRNVWVKGHTDTGAISILYSQPVAALQILAKDGTWKWVRHIENAIVINTGDAMQFLSGGLYPATIHRVYQPPPDQRNITRAALFYFCMPDDDIVLTPVVKTKSGASKEDESHPVCTMKEWRMSRTRSYGRIELTKAANGVDEEETVKGVTVKHYN